MLDIDKEWLVELKSKNDELNKAIDSIYAAIQHVVNLSENFGLPFEMRFLTQSRSWFKYVPKSFEKSRKEFMDKYDPCTKEYFDVLGEFNSNLLVEVNSIDDNPGWITEDDGWIHSSSFCN